MDTQTTNNVVIVGSHTRGIQTADNGMTAINFMPVIDTKKEYLKFKQDLAGMPQYTPEGTKLIVRGVGYIDVPNSAQPLKADYDSRWCTISATEFLKFVEIAERDGTVKEVRALSVPAGVSVRRNGQSRRYLGSEPAVLLQFIGSEEAEELAEQYSFHGTVKNVINLANGSEIEVSYKNALIATKQAVLAAKGMGIYPYDDSVPVLPSRADADNPDWLDAIAFAKQTGRLPERSSRTSKVASNATFQR